MLGLSLLDPCVTADCTFCPLLIKKKMKDLRLSTIEHTQGLGFRAINLHPHHLSRHSVPEVHIDIYIYIYIYIL